MQTGGQHCSLPEAMQQVTRTPTRKITHGKKPKKTKTSPGPRDILRKNCPVEAAKVKPKTKTSRMKKAAENEDFRLSPSRASHHVLPLHLRQHVLPVARLFEALQRGFQVGHDHSCAVCSSTQLPLGGLELKGSPFGAMTKYGPTWENHVGRKVDSLGPTESKAQNTNLFVGVVKDIAKGQAPFWGVSKRETPKSKEGEVWLI